MPSTLYLSIVVTASTMGTDWLVTAQSRRHAPHSRPSLISLATNSSPIPSSCRLGKISFGCITGTICSTLWHTFLHCLHHNIRLVKSFSMLVYSCEPLACHCLLVQPLGATLLALIHLSFNKIPQERQPSFLMQLQSPRHLPVFLVRRDDSRVSEELPP